MTTSSSTSTHAIRYIDHCVTTSSPLTTPQIPPNTNANNVHPSPCHPPQPQPHVMPYDNDHSLPYHNNSNPCQTLTPKWLPTPQLPAPSHAHPLTEQCPTTSDGTNTPTATPPAPSIRYHRSITGIEWLGGDDLPSTTTSTCPTSTSCLSRHQL